MGHRQQNSQTNGNGYQSNTSVTPIIENTRKVIRYWNYSVVTGEGTGAESIMDTMKTRFNRDGGNEVKRGIIRVAIGDGRPSLIISRGGQRFEEWTGVITTEIGTTSPYTNPSRGFISKISYSIQSPVSPISTPVQRVFPQYQVVRTVAKAGDESNLQMSLLPLRK